MIQTLVRLDPKDGNDSIEATCVFPVLPRKGDLIEAATATGIEHVEVVAVIFPVYGAPVELWVEYEGYDLNDARSVMEGIGARAIPA